MNSKSNSKTSLRNAYMPIDIAIATALVIVLVCASVIITRVLLNYSHNKEARQFKAVYGRLNKTIKSSQMQNGPITNWNYNTGQTLINFVKKYFIPYMNVSKDCSTKQNEGCFAKNKFYKRLNGSKSPNAFDNSSAGYKVILATGESLYFTYNPNCVENKQRCIDIYVDIDGPNQGPSQFGRDLFLFYVYPYTNELKPFGTYSNDIKQALSTDLKHWNSYPYDSDCHSNGWGMTCGTKIITDGYQINY